MAGTASSIMSHCRMFWRIEPGAQVLAQLAERTIRHAGHGGDEQIVAELETGKFHGRVGGFGLSREAGDFT